jgi:dUTP pyrophosphatase
MDSNNPMNSPLVINNRFLLIPAADITDDMFNNKANDLPNKPQDDPIETELNKFGEVEKDKTKYHPKYVVPSRNFITSHDHKELMEPDIVSAISNLSDFVANLSNNPPKLNLKQNSSELQVMKLHKDAIIPQRPRDGDVGYDLISYRIDHIDPRSKGLIPTGLAMKLPPGWYGRISSKSGLSLQNSVEVGAGILDPIYRGEVNVLLYNHSSKPFVITRGMKIAQLILSPYHVTDVTEVDSLDSTERGSGGFGSTGSHVPLHDRTSSDHSSCLLCQCSQESNM